ncbi:hypothetical protein Tco_0465171 [Tanacetum coccineum]
MVVATRGWDDGGEEEDFSGRLKRSKRVCWSRDSGGGANLKLSECDGRLVGSGGRRTNKKGLPVEKVVLIIEVFLITNTTLTKQNVPNIEYSVEELSEFGYVYNACSRHQIS